MTKAALRILLTEEIKGIFDIEITNFDENLLNQRLNIATVDFLYFFSVLEEKYKINIYRVLEKNDSKVFTVNNLATEIEAMQLNDNRNN